MNYKKWLYSGGALLVGSTVAGFVVPGWAIASSFDALEANPSASIDSVSAGIQWALFFTIFFLATGVIGMVVLGIGGVKAYRYNQSGPDANV